MAVDLSMPVLVVDDYQTMIRIIRNLLNQLGFKNIEEAKDGRQALEKLNGGKFGCYAPPFSSDKWLARSAFMEKAGARWWPIANCTS